MFSRLQYWFGNGWMGIADLLITAFCVFLSLSIHEVAHGFIAYKLGDDTAKNSGRLSLSPLRHLDPIGALCLFLFGFGWANPVPVNPRNFDRVKMKTGMVLTSLAGPASNLIVAFIAAFLMHIVGAFEMNMPLAVIYLLLSNLIVLNIGIAVFNLIPIPPLDGYKVLSAVLPPRYYFKLMQYERFGFIILLLIIYIPVFNSLLSSAVMGIMHFYDFILGFLPF